jgi:mono-ADP-ribosyltransferase sirtuin 6
MALVELQNRGILKYLVSQNCDGLHRRSGILPVRKTLASMNCGLLTACRREYPNSTGIATERLAKTAARNIFEVNTNMKFPLCNTVSHAHT